MSDKHNIGQTGNHEDELLLRMVSELSVPASSKSKEDIWQQINQSIEAEEQKKRFRVKLMYWSAAAIVLIAVVSGVLEWQFAWKTVEAPAGNIAYGILPDSSVVILNAGTVLKHREYNFKRNRKVKIKGEALFDVKPGENEFVVMAGKSSITVLGTKFNVFYRSSLLKVECLSGEVKVNVNSTAEKKLTAGFGLNVSVENMEVKDYYIEPQRTASWSRGELYFDDKPLNFVLDELSRQFNVKIQIQGFDPTQRSYSGYFTTENLRNALNLVCLPMGLTYDLSTDSSGVKIFPQ